MPLPQCTKASLRIMFIFKHELKSCSGHLERKFKIYSKYMLLFYFNICQGVFHVKLTSEVRHWFLGCTPMLKVGVRLRCKDQKSRQLRFVIITPVYQRVQFRLYLRRHANKKANSGDLRVYVHGIHLRIYIAMFFWKIFSIKETTSLFSIHTFV